MADSLAAFTRLLTTIPHRREEGPENWPGGLRLGMHAGAPADDQVPRRVHQVVVPPHDLARSFVIPVVFAKLPKPVRQARHRFQAARNQKIPHLSDPHLHRISAGPSCSPRFR